MRRIGILPAPPTIAIGEEPLGDERGDLPPVAVEGFELVPASQARPAWGRLRVLAAVPALAVAAAVALSLSPGHEATPMRAGAVKPVAPTGPTVVVQAS